MASPLTLDREHMEHHIHTHTRTVFFSRKRKRLYRSRLECRIAIAPISYFHVNLKQLSELEHTKSLRNHDINLMFLFRNT